MNKTGYVRKIDILGRLVIPAELRSDLDVGENDKIEFFTDNNSIILKKYTPSCCFCGSKESLTEYREKYICKKCLADLKK